MFPPETGPFVAMAVLCQRVEQRADGSVDVLGIVDGVVVQPEGDDALGLHPAARLSLTALVSVRAGGLNGRHQLGIQSRYPSGRPGSLVEREVELSSQAPAASLVVPVELEIHEPGVYWFDAVLDGRLLTRMHLWVQYGGA